MSSIHVLGRLLVIDRGHVLLAHEIGAGNSFLPGGHVEYNEPVETAILREFKEEFGGEVEVGDFIGVVEHSFESKGRPYHELNLLFAGRLTNLAYPETPKSLEPQLEFYWRPISGLREANLLPSPLIAMIEDFSRTGRASLLVSTMR